MDMDGDAAALMLTVHAVEALMRWPGTDYGGRFGREADNQSSSLKTSMGLEALFFPFGPSVTGEGASGTSTSIASLPFGPPLPRVVASSDNCDEGAYSATHA